MTDDRVGDALLDAIAVVRADLRGDEDSIKVILANAEHWNVARAIAFLFTRYVIGDDCADCADVSEEYKAECQADLDRFLDAHLDELLRAREAKARGEEEAHHTSIRAAQYGAAQPGCGRRVHTLYWPGQALPVRAAERT